MTKILPCPYCRAPITLTRSRFFPSRRAPIACPSCSSLTLLPWPAVLLGLLVMMAFMIVGMLAVKPLFQRGALETPLDFLGAGAAFLAIVVACMWIGSWISAQATQALAPYRKAT